MAFPATSAVTAPSPPLTTPFVVPSSCTGNFNFTTTITDERGVNTYKTVYLLNMAPDVADCNHGQTPSATHTDMALTFSPAVCPSAWTAYDLQIDTAGSGSSQRSSAWCCPSGFKPTNHHNYHYSTNTRACVQTLARTTSSQADDYGLTVTQLLETPWLITWAKSDTETMSPRPPRLGGRCTRVEIATWVPGATVSKSDRVCAEQDHGPDILGSWAFWFLVVGLPVIVVTIPSIWCCCVRPGRRRRRERRAREKRAGAAGVATAAAPETQRVHEPSADP